MFRQEENHTLRQSRKRLLDTLVVRCSHKIHQPVRRYIHQFLGMFGSIHSRNIHNELFHRKCNQQKSNSAAKVAEHKNKVVEEEGEEDPVQLALPNQNC
jgi:hypothetical protein